MAIKSVLSKTEEFTGEFPVITGAGASWRFNDIQPDEELRLADSSANGRHLAVSGFSGTTAALSNGRYGRYFRQNISSPASEKTYLRAVNDGSFFANLGGKIAVGGWINPTTYSVGNTYCPIFNTRQGQGQPIFYLSLYQGKPRMMLYNDAGTLILDQTETPSFSMVNGGWYFIAAIIGVTAKTSQYVLCNRADGAEWVSPLRTYTGTLNPSCTADIVLGMHADTYWFAGGFDDWFFEIGSSLSIDDLIWRFRQAMLANGADMTSAVDAYAEDGGVTLRTAGGAYPASGALTTTAAPCSLGGDGRVSAASEYIAGVNAVSLVETATSDDLTDWTAWQPIGTNGELVSPNAAWVKYRVTLTTSDTSVTPKLLSISLFDVPKSPYKRLGYARPVVLGESGEWDAVLENAYDILAVSEINGIDTLTFKLPFSDSKRAALGNEKRILVVDTIYRVRTVTDKKESGGAVSEIYAESLFCDLAFCGNKSPVQFTNSLANVPLAFALEGTGWTVGRVTVSTRRTWDCEEKNALAILRAAQKMHGGDLVFDTREQTVSLLTFGGADGGALFAYGKNLTGVTRATDTTGVVTRLYAVGSGGLTFASINGGKPYVEDFSYLSEVRVGSLDLNDFTDAPSMLDFTRLRLAEYAKPRVSYVLSAMDLSVLSGYEHEKWALGDVVTVDDRELDLRIKTRIVRREYNLREPWNTKLELSTKLRELGDSSGQLAKIQNQLDQTNSFGAEQSVRQLVPFNHLKNSRADSGFAYWENSGFGIDYSGGASGDAAFTASGSFGVSKSLSQTVYPAQRQVYTFSAQFASENVRTSANTQIGVEVQFEYEDGTKETQFIDFLKAEAETPDDTVIADVIGGVPEAPRDGKAYLRAMERWVESTDTLTEAPCDGFLYGRVDGRWERIMQGSGIPPPYYDHESGFYDFGFDDRLKRPEGYDVPNADSYMVVIKVPYLYDNEAQIWNWGNVSMFTENIPSETISNTQVIYVFGLVRQDGVLKLSEPTRYEYEIRYQKSREAYFITFPRSCPATFGDKCETRKRSRAICKKRDAHHIKFLAGGRFFFEDRCESRH